VNADGPIGVVCSRQAGAAAMAAQLLRRMPHEDVLVVSDDGWQPWARRPGRVIAVRIAELAGELAAGGAKAIMVASLQGTLDGLDAARAAAPGVPVLGFEPAAVVARAAAEHPGQELTVVVAPGSVRLPQLTAALKQLRSGGIATAEPGAAIRGVAALASAGACGSPPAGVTCVSAAEVAGDRVHRLLVRDHGLARRRRAGRVLAMSSHPAAGVHR
jgi:hypothetical protein